MRKAENQFWSLNDNQIEFTGRIDKILQNIGSVHSVQYILL